MEPDRADLYYARHRYYHPHIGRFISEDPIGLAGGMNLYAYVGGDPVNFTDPLGLSPVSIGPAANPWFVFDDGDVEYGLETGFHGAMSGLSFGLYDGGIYRCREHFAGSQMGGMAAGVIGFYAAAPAIAAGGAAVSARASIAIATAGARARLAAGAGAAAAAAGKKALDGCFPAGTLVVMADGSAKPIEKVREGDLVLSRDAATGWTGARRAFSTLERTAGELVTVTLADPATGAVAETLSATPDHPFFVEGRGWVELGQVGVGSEIVTRAGPTLTVRSVSRQPYPDGVSVYNFAVEGTHSYFVGNALGGAWVHNNTCPFGRGALSSVSELQGVSYVATQPSVSAPKINEMAAIMRAGKWNWSGREIEVSGNRIIEGHHRYIAALLANEKPVFKTATYTKSMTFDWNQLIVDPGRWPGGY